MMTWTKHGSLWCYSSFLWVGERENVLELSPIYCERSKRLGYAVRQVGSRRIVARRWMASHWVPSLGPILFFADRLILRSGWRPYLWHDGHVVMCCFARRRKIGGTTVSIGPAIAHWLGPCVAVVSGDTAIGLFRDGRFVPNWAVLDSLQDAEDTARMCFGDLLVSH